MDTLTVIFVTFNSHAVIANCLAQLVDDPSLKIVIVDNKSTDDTPALIKARFPGVEVIAQQQNIGYGRAANVMLRRADTPYALLLNPDLTTTPADIRRLWDYAKSDTSNTAIWGPATLRKDFTGEPPEQVEWVSGSAMLFDVDKIRRVGLFDENIFLFSEETELCERTIKAGYSIKFCRDIFFDHLVGQATPLQPENRVHEMVAFRLVPVLSHGQERPFHALQESRSQVHCLSHSQPHFHIGRQTHEMEGQGRWLACLYSR